MGGQVLGEAADDGSLAKLLKPKDREDSLKADEDSLKAKARQVLTEATSDGSLAKLLKPQESEDSLRAKTRQVLCAAAADGSLRNELAEEAAKRSKQAVSPQKELVVVSPQKELVVEVFPQKELVVEPCAADLVRPPTALTEEQAEDFRLQVEDFREDLSDDQIMKCLIEFSKFENRAQGTIPTECLGDVLRALGHKPNVEAWKVIMFELDEEGLGTITFPQLLSVMVDRINDEKAVQELIPAFKMFDRNGDGFVSSSVISRVMQGLRDQWSFPEEQVSEMIKKIGVNGNGQINYVEFASVMVVTEPRGAA